MSATQEGKIGSLDKLRALAAARTSAHERILKVMMRGAEALGRGRKPADGGTVQIHFAYDFDGDMAGRRIAMWWETVAVDRNGRTGSRREHWEGEKPTVLCIITPDESPASVYQQALIFAQWGTEIIVRQVQEELAKAEAEAEHPFDKEIAAFEAIGACVDHDDCKDHPGLACACDKKTRSVGAVETCPSLSSRMSTPKRDNGPVIPGFSRGGDGPPAPWCDRCALHHFGWCTS